MARSFGAESIGADGFVVRGPLSAAPSVGCALVELGSNQLGWTSRPVVISPAVGPAANSDYLSPIGWTPLPTVDLSSRVAKSGDSMSGPLTGPTYIQIASGVQLYSALGNLAVKDSTGTNYSNILAQSVILTGSVSARPLTSSSVGLAITGQSGQTGNLFEARDSTNAVVASIGPTGALTLTNSGKFAFNSSVYTSTVDGEGLWFCGNQPGGTARVVTVLRGGTNGEIIGIQLPSDAIVGWGSSLFGGGANVDTRLVRNATGQLDVRGDGGLRIRNLANSADADLAAGAATFSGSVVIGGDIGNVATPFGNVIQRGDWLNYNAGFTGATNYERGYARWNSNRFYIGVESAGTGQNRALSIKAAGGVSLVEGSRDLTFNGNVLQSGPGNCNLGSSSYPFGSLWFSGTITQGSNDARWTIPAAGQRNSQVGNGSGTWQTGYREAYNVAGVQCGFFGATPVSQPSIAVAATDAASTQTLANSLRTAFLALGLGV